MSRVRSLALAVLLLTVAVAIHVGSAARYVRVLTVRTEDGQLFEAFPVVPGDSFSLSYVHSIYGAPAEERFLIDEHDRLRLVAINSASQAVLEYYGPGAGDPSIVPSVAVLPVIADRIGQRTLEIAGRRLPLYRFGDGVHLRLQVERWSPWRSRLVWASLRTGAAGRP